MQAERVFFPTIFKVKNRIPGNQMNQPEVLFEKKFVRFHCTFYSVRHIFTFMGLSYSIVKDSNADLTVGN